MSSEPKPIKKFGKRNFFCRHYNCCLDYAVNQHWRNFACPSGCAFIRDKSALRSLVVNED
ncbi:MAG: hypothetical protein M1426_03350 [Patescibacteria group bacterium]|nr:hypothetical protein [Patescibacteria group bacterium]